MRRNQPYIPLYVQDFLTDEKLMECSASATGVYIRIMCIMHKSEEYGVILLKQKDKQNESKIKNFACKVAKHLPYSLDIIEQGLIELIEEGVLKLEDDKLIQKRMVADNLLSIIRAESGSKGGSKTFAQAKCKAKPNQIAQAKSEANSEYENEYEIETVNAIKTIIEDLNLVCSTEFKHTSEKTRKLIKARLNENYTIEDFKKVHRNKFANWSNNPDMVKFLRPETLYGTKFESYLNEKQQPKQQEPIKPTKSLRQQLEEEQEERDRKLQAEYDAKLKAGAL